MLSDERQDELVNDLHQALRTQKAENELDELVKDYRKLQLKLRAMSCRDVVNIRARLAEWIIDNLNEDGQLVKTQRVVAEECKDWISLAGVTRTLQALCAGRDPILIMQTAGVYELTPKLATKYGYRRS